MSYENVQNELDEISELLQEINDQPNGNYDEIDINDSIYLRPIWQPADNHTSDPAAVEGRIED